MKLLWNRFVLASGNLFFRFRNALFPLIFGLLFIFTKPHVNPENVVLDFLSIGIGFFLVLLGQAYRLLVIGYAYIDRGGKNRRISATDLVEKGFYAHSRNPMYLGNVLIVIGLSIMYGSLEAYLLVVPLFLFAYGSITVAEENYLRNQFGERYADYEKRVNRFWPNFKGIRKSLEAFEYNWKRALRKEYGTLFTVFTTALFIATWNAYYLFGPDTIKIAFLIVSGLVVFYSIVRFLKKKKYLAT
ncbi:MAG: DUF1295 domain-containing protein [Deltaproteobacteria bacterium]|nr:DUF1295 domain-containing protein [Deltaproteobacteria bacterium]